MLKYTIAAFRKIASEVKLLAHYLTLTVSLSLSAYLIVNCFLGVGYVLLNATLATVTVVNLLVYLFTYKNTQKGAKRVRRVVKRICNVAKLLLNAISLGSSVYTIVTSPEAVGGFSLVFTPILIIVWVVSVALELISIYLERRLELIVNAFRMDFEGVLRPVHAVSSFVSGMLGDESRPTHEVDPHYRSLLEGCTDGGAEKKTKSGRLSRVKSIFKRKKRDSE